MFVCEKQSCLFVLGKQRKVCGGGSGCRWVAVGKMASRAGSLKVIRCLSTGDGLQRWSRSSFYLIGSDCKCGPNESFQWV